MKKRKQIVTVLVIVLVLTASVTLFFTSRKKVESPGYAINNQGSIDSIQDHSKNTEPVSTTVPKPKPTQTTPQYSLTDPSSIWVVVNKKNGIPVSYKPSLVVPGVRLRLASSEEQMQIRPDVAKAVEAMFAVAKKDKVNLVFGSGYRSGNLQGRFYNSYVAKDGQKAADRYSARPGHSEHQTGLAFDLTSPGGKCHLETCWEDTPEGKWAAKNAYKYGFILRYQDGKESITGYQYEPWHFRYVGTKLADQINQTGQTLEEFFGLPPAPNYD